MGSELFRKTTQSYNYIKVNSKLLHGRHTHTHSSIKCKTQNTDEARFRKSRADGRSECCDVIITTRCGARVVIVADVGDARRESDVGAAIGSGAAWRWPQEDDGAASVEDEGERQREKKEEETHH